MHVLWTVLSARLFVKLMIFIIFIPIVTTHAEQTCPNRRRLPKGGTSRRPLFDFQYTEKACQFNSESCPRTVSGNAIQRNLKITMVYYQSHFVNLTRNIVRLDYNRRSKEEETTLDPLPVYLLARVLILPDLTTCRLLLICQTEGSPACLAIAFSVFSNCVFSNCV